MPISIKYSRVNHDVHPDVVKKEAERVIKSIPNSVIFVMGELRAVEWILNKKIALRNHVYEFKGNSLLLRLDDINQKLESFNITFGGVFPERVIFGILYPNKVNIEEVRRFASRCVEQSFCGTIDFFANKENSFCKLNVYPSHSLIEVIFNFDEGDREDVMLQFAETVKICEDLCLVKTERQFIK